MMANMLDAVKGKRLSSDAGIAIGPILFIVAILGILAAAIAAGSGSFSVSTTAEGTRTKAAALLDIGQNLKIGFDRIIGLGITDVGNVVINVTKTANENELFSPNGGGIAAPSTTMAASATSDDWKYPLLALPNIGTAAGSRVAMLRVSADVCTELNAKGAGLAATPGNVDFGNVDSTALITDTSSANWPTELAGKMTGCVGAGAANGTTGAGYYFFQVLGIQ